MNYGEMKQAIEDYVQNSEATFTTNIPLFIELAEERLLKHLRLNLFQRNQSGALTASNQYLAAPSDFLSPLSLSIESGGVKTFLLFKELEFLQEAYPDASSTATPVYFAQFDVDNFLIAPTPDATYTVDIHYQYRPASLTAGAESGTTWMSENAELALLYGALVEAYTFMKGQPDLLQTYDNRFNEALASLRVMGIAEETTTDYREGRQRGPRE